MDEHKQHDHEREHDIDGLAASATLPHDDLQPGTTATAQASPTAAAGDDTALTFSGEAFRYAIIAITFFTVGILVGALGFGQRMMNATTMEVVLRDVLADFEFSGGEADDDRFELVDDDPYLGPEDAPVVIVEFSDYQCPFCGRHFEQTLEPILENYGEYVRYVYRDFAGIGPQSVPAALASECAHDQDAFWDFHEALFSNQQQLSRGYYISLAEEFELDVATFTTCLDEAQHQSEIAGDQLDGQVAGVRGTPGFFINGFFISGAREYAIFERVIQRELDEAGIDWRG